MKLTPLTVLLLLTVYTYAQKPIRYYNVEWKECEVAHARFLTITEHTDSGWHRIDYYLVKTPKLQMAARHRTQPLRSGIVQTTRNFQKCTK